MSHAPKALEYVPLFAPIVILLASIPLALGLVPPNCAFGFRTPKTLTDDEVWFKANRLAGINLIIASLVMIAGLLALPRVFPGLRDVALFNVGLIGGELLAAFAVSLLQLRRL